jgi:hypothetical protein
VAVHVDQMGVDEVNPELPQIQDIVVPFLPENLKFLYAVNATREIVNGFKWEIVFVMKNEANEEIVCEMDVLEKPWLMKNAKKFRKMTYNNCSLENSVDDDDKIRFQYEINPTFVNQRTEMSASDMIDMEDLIVTTKPKKTTTVRTTTTTVGSTTTVEPTTTEESEEVTLAPLDPSSKNILDNFFNMNNFFPPPPTTTTTTLSPLSNMNLDALDEMFGIKKVANTQAEPRTDESSREDENFQQKRVESVETAATSKNESALKDLEIEIKKVFSELFQSDPEFQMNIIALINRKDDTNAQKNYNYVIAILTNKLKEKIENLTDRRNEEDAQQVTVDATTAEPSNEEIRERRSTNIRDLTEDALETLDHFDADDDKRVLVNIIGVKGKKNVLKVEAAIANSHCKENSHEIDECEKRIDRNSVKVCLFEVKFWVLDLNFR